MVKVPVNADISAFKTTVYAGLTAKQVISALVGLALCVPFNLILSLVFKVDIYVSVVASLPLMFAAIYVVNYEKNDFNLFETYKYGLNKKRTDLLIYRSTENVDVYKSYYENQCKLEKKIKNKNLDEDALFDFYMKIFKIGVTCFVLIVIGIFALLILSKVK